MKDGGAALAVGLVAIGAAAYRFRDRIAAAVAPVLGGSGSSGSSGSSSGSGLSPRRLRALQVVASVVPSKYGDKDKDGKVTPAGERFATMAPSYDPSSPSLPKGFTTCAYLPGYVGSQLGINTRYGLASIRDVARAAGAWVDAGGDRRPKPGDFFLVGTADGGIAHVGVIVDASGATWRTADAGQGARDAQEARYVDRAYDAAAVTLGGPAGPRPLVGWMDIDKMPGAPKPASVAGPEAAPVLLVDGGADGGETTAPAEPARPARKAKARR